MAGSTTGANAKFVRANLVEAVKLYGDHRPPLVWKDMVVGKIISSKQLFEEAAMASGIPLPSITSEYGAVPQAEMRQVNTQTWQPFKRAIQVRMSREFMKDEQYGLAKSYGQQIAAVSDRADEIDGAVYLTKCLDGSSTGLPLWDGKSYAATDHPTDSGTYSNRFAAPESLGITALETAVQNMMGFVSHMGYIDPRYGPFQLEVTHANAMLARRLIQSEKFPTTSDNDPNVIRGLITKVVVNPYAGSTPNYWAVHSIHPMENRRFMIDREPLNVTDLIYDGDNDSYKATAVRRKIFGVFDARDSYFSPAS